MPTKKKPETIPAPLPPSPTTVGDPAEARLAFESVRAEVEALPDAEVMIVNVDVPHAVSVCLGAIPHVAPLVPTIAHELPTANRAAIERLRAFALAALYGHIVASPPPRPAELPAMLGEAGDLRAALLVAAEALAHRGLLDRERVARIRSGNGHLALAGDLVALGTTFDLAWSSVAGKTAVTRAEVDRALVLGPALLEALGAREHALSDAKSAEAQATRARTFTLFVRAYDEARRAVTFLRWKEGDADEILPSLYQKRAKKRPAAEEKPEEANGQAAPGV